MMGRYFRKAQSRILVGNEPCAERLRYVLQLRQAEHGNGAAAHCVGDERRAIFSRARQRCEKITRLYFAAVACQSREFVHFHHGSDAHITRRQNLPRLWFHYEFSLTCATTGFCVGMPSIGAMRAMTRPARGADV